MILGDISQQAQAGQGQTKNYSGVHEDSGSEDSDFDIGGIGIGAESKFDEFDVDSPV